MPEIVWECVPFEELTNHQLYSILQLRNEVFIVEQNCAYQDLDNKDQKSFHLMGWAGKDLAAYARLLPKGVSYEYISIGRVITSPKYRKSGAGKSLMKEAIHQCNILFGKHPIKIGAQLYLQKFYGALGFTQTSDMYLEDGIEHIEMLRDAEI
ncbi:MAG TPA: GNAT family N-acetyltransferase [Segetibacter sp.]|jgi:ElaA protein